MSKKRFRPLGEVIRMGLVEDGALLRYVVRHCTLRLSEMRDPFSEAARSHACGPFTFCCMLAVQRSVDGRGPSSADWH